jgi:predicted thioredoxin/glutaredoxin
MTMTDLKIFQRFALLLVDVSAVILDGRLCLVCDIEPEREPCIESLLDETNKVDHG